MKNIELLIEAIECYEKDWWQEEYTKEEAIKIINNALKEEPEENQIVIFISLVEPNTNIFENDSPVNVYKECLRKLKKDINNDDL